MPYASNATFLVEVCRDGASALAIYKPARGERPLWDFPPGLHTREVAAFALAEALGWDVVPPTVLRHDAPLGEGSLQAFVDADVEAPTSRCWRCPSCTTSCGASRCSTCCPTTPTARAGTCWSTATTTCGPSTTGCAFHAEFKLRTVVWDFAGEPVPPGLAGDVRRLVEGGLPDELARLLDPFERDALLARGGRAVADAPALPHDPTGRRYPWPLV